MFFSKTNHFQCQILNLFDNRSVTACQISDNCNNNNDLCITITYRLSLRYKVTLCFDRIMNRNLSHTLQMYDTLYG